MSHSYELTVIPAQAAGNQAAFDKADKHSPKLTDDGVRAKNILRRPEGSTQIGSALASLSAGATGENAGSVLTLLRAFL